mmetsp:Transcript_8610/g.25858  ORF Transcript_8610/g.25858 Transcript_8610/m.25858 type:complete len:641 (+) Transcript_8610:373-2295(+)
MGQHAGLFSGRSRGGGAGCPGVAAVAARVAIRHLGRLEEGLSGALLGPRRLVLLSLLANVVLLVLVLLRAAPQASVHLDLPCLAPLLQPDVRGHTETVAEREAARRAGVNPLPITESVTAQLARGKAVAVAAAAGDAGGEQEPLPLPKAGRPAWLVVGVPSAPRQRDGKDVDYLGPTLESLLAELPDDPIDPLYGRVRVIVMDTAPGRNHAVRQLRSRIRARREGDGFAAKAAVYLEVIDNPGDLKDPTPGAPDPDDLHNPDDRPGKGVRQQTLDLITLMGLARGRGTLYMFLEDDFRVCPYTIRAVHYALAKLHNQQPNWLALRISYGMNGVVMRTKDIPSLIRHFKAGVARKPCDILWQEWAVGTKRPRELGVRQLSVYRYNMMAHRGDVSSFPVRMHRRKWPGCFEKMARAWSLHIRERYNEGTCAHVSDIFPCASRGTANARGGGGQTAGTVDEQGKPNDWTAYPLQWPDGARDPSPPLNSLDRMAGRAAGKAVDPRLHGASGKKGFVSGGGGDIRMAAWASASDEAERDRMADALGNSAGDSGDYFGVGGSGSIGASGRADGHGEADVGFWGSDGRSQGAAAEVASRAEQRQRDALEMAQRQRQRARQGKQQKHLGGDGLSAAAREAIASAQAAG